MAAKNGERSALSATRFTATTPHASSKTASKVPEPKSRFPPASKPTRPAGAGRPLPQSGGQGSTIETPEQRVARLRAAHAAAKNAKVSMFDQVLAKSRPFFDSAHRITVISLVGLTAVAGLMTAYTAYDMLRHNRKRKAEFNELQQKMAADSLEAARLAYMRGDATDEQINLVEQVNARSEGGGQGFKMPSILSAPTPLRTEEQTGDKPSSSEAETQAAENKSSGLWGWFSSKPKKDEAQGASEPAPSRTLEEKRALIESAKAAFEKEKENQRNGGPLDRLGTQQPVPESVQAKDAEQPKKKGWLW